jgi:cytochrome c-type biogenesis protein CcmH/NrfF
MDYELISGKKTIKTAWMANHITRMMGAMIASYTAFLVVNIKIQQNWILWLLPTVVGSVFISTFLKKYAPRKKETDILN